MTCISVKYITQIACTYIYAKRHFVRAKKQEISSYYCIRQRAPLTGDALP